MLTNKLILLSEHVKLRKKKMMKMLTFTRLEHNNFFFLGTEHNNLNYI